MACGCNNTGKHYCGCGDVSPAETVNTCGCKGSVLPESTSPCGCGNGNGNGSVGGVSTGSCGCRRHRGCPSITCGVKQAADGFAKGVDTILSSIFGCCRR